MSEAADELEAFRDPERVQEGPLEQSEQSVSRDLLLFEFAGDLYGIDANLVVGVVPWKTPALVPGVDSRVRGVIQDRGRIVVVIGHPAARSDAPTEREPARIIICATTRGHVGLPAMATRSVGPVELRTAPTPLSVYEGKLGPFTFLDPSRYGDHQRAASNT